MAIFSKKQEPSNTNENVLSGSINLIGVGTSITGDVSCKGDIRMDGNIIGNIISKSKVVIGTTGVVTGDVSCSQADISGYIKGDITVAETLFLKATARVEGDIITNKLIVEAGAIFTGNCNMGVVSEKLLKPNAGKERPAKEMEATAG
jgi:cytoskeletal protein CcmA (bactofilin family)